MTGGGVFGSFQIVSEVARGGQGAVYRALHQPTGRPVALKLLTDTNASARKRFAQEGRVLARLQHPNVLRVVDHGVHEETAFLATELVQGPDLAKWVEENGLPPMDASARLLARVADALHYCHSQGIVHRDLKPANVLVEQGTGRPVLIDFGLVKRDANQMHMASLDASVMSASGNVKGTPGYMSPEQVNPGEFGDVGPATDVYGLGAILYFLLCGRAPFEGRAMVVVMRKVTRKPPQDPRELNPQLSEAVAAVCLRALAKRAGERFESADAFAQALCQAAGVAVPSPQETPVHAPQPPSDSRDADLGSSAPEAFAPSLPSRLPGAGDVFAGCTIEKEIGRGGMGAVFVARRPDGARCALKVVLGDMNDERRRERFLREAQVGKEVQHPGIVQTLARGEEGGVAYLVLELVEDALPLDAYVRAHDVSVAGKVQLILQVAQALEVAHAADLIHRDLKPDNVLVTPSGQVKVLDFGLALHLDKERLTLSGAILGTISYMAPEQVMGRAHDATPGTDVWALGVMLYELVKGELPFSGSTSVEVMAGIIDDEPEDPCAGIEGASPEISAVIQVALAKDPQRRYPNAAAFGRDLVAASSGSGHVSAVEQIQKRSRQRTAVRVLTALAVLAVVLLGATVAVLKSRRLSDADVRERLGQLSDRTRALFEAKGAPLGERGALAAAVGADLDAMLAKAEFVSDEKRVARVRSRLRTLEGLSALARGDVEAAQASLAAIEGQHTYEVGALVGGLAAHGHGDPGDALEQLSRAIQRGVKFSELRAWRAQLRGQQDGEALSASAAEEVLGDLRRVARTRALSERERAARGRAELALGRVDEAAATLAGLSEPPRALRWGVVLATAPQDLEGAPGAVQARLEQLPDPVPTTPAAVAFTRQVHALLTDALAIDGRLVEADFLRLLPHLLIADRMQAVVPIPDRLRELLLRHTDVVVVGEVLDPARAFALALAAAFPDDLVVQRQIGLLTDWVYTATDKLELVVPLRRAVELAEPGEERRGLQAKLCIQLGWCSERREGDRELAEEVIALATSLLEQVQDPTERGWLYLARGGAHRGLGQLREALADFNRAIEARQVTTFYYMRAKTLWELAEEPERTFDDAYRFGVGQSNDSGYTITSLVIAWELHASSGSVAKMAEFLRVYTRLSPGKWGWLLRLAKLEFALGDPQAAREAVALSLPAFENWTGTQSNGNPERKPIEDRTRALLKGWTGSASDRGELDAIVDALERLRRTEPRTLNNIP